MKSPRTDITLLITFFIFLLMPSALVSAEQKKAPASQDQLARKKINDLEKQLLSQSHQIELLRTEVTENKKSQAASTDALDSAAKARDKEIEGLKKQNAYNSELSSAGAIILLVGLLMEILGALLLGAPVLATKIEELSDFEIDPSIDLATHSPKKEAVLAFYSMIGNIFLFLGFTAQFAGTALVLSVDWTNQILIVLSGLVFGFLILIWLLGIDPTQTRKQKLSVVWRNIVRVGKLKVYGLLYRGKGCDVCLKKVRKNDSYISWYDQGNSSSHPYLHMPGKFLVGHEACLIKNINDRIEGQANIEARAKIKPHYQLIRGTDFISTRLEKYKQWFVGYYDSWDKKRSDVRRPSLRETELDMAASKIRKIDS